MNRIHRIVWSASQSAWVVADERARARGKRASGAAGVAARTLAAALGTAAAVAVAGPPGPPASNALPTGAVVTAGQASIVQDGAAMSVQQSSQKAIVQWQSFSIGANASVHFAQPGLDAVALNRVVGGDLSSIFGRLSADGQVFLVNPNGVLFGASAQVDVGGLVASALSIGDADFLGGHYRFMRQGATGAVVSEGAITGTYAALLAPEVRNAGTIVAPMGTVVLAAGEAVTLGIAGHKLVDVQVDRATVDALVENRHMIRVDGGTAILSAQSAQALLGRVVNSGAVEAGGIDASGGTVRLTASHAIHLGGRITADAGGQGNGGQILAIADLGDKLSHTTVTGVLSARGAAAGGDGGFIETSASVLKVAGSARIDTSAPSGAVGRWLLDPYDFTIAAVGGDITGAALSSALATTNITIQTADTGASCSPMGCGSGNIGGNGDIHVNDAVTWGSDRTLTLSAWRDVNINAPITVNGTGKLALAFGQSGNESDFPEGNYFVNAPINLSVGAAFSTKLAIDGLTVDHVVIHDAAGLSAIAGDLSGSYVLGANIVATATSWTPLGDAFNPFGGSFDGLGHTVQGLVHVNGGSDENVGLFGFNLGLIRNVGVVGADIDGSRNVGALVGFNNGFVVNSYATGTVKGSGTTVGGIGGLVGYSLGPIQMSYADVTVSAPGGDQTSGDPLADGTGGVGGLVGVLGGVVADSYARGSVLGGGSVGGLVGYSAGTISASYSAAAVSGASNVGGFVGSTFGTGFPSIFGSYWDTTTSGQVAGGGAPADTVTGLDTAAMKSPSTFASWDRNVWELRDGQYPMLKQMLKPVFIVADDKTATYTGNPYTAFSYSHSPSGFPDGALTGVVGFTTSTLNATDAGTYTITPGGVGLVDASLQNGYRLSFVDGTLTINPAALTVTANNASKTYDGAPYSGGAGVTYAGFVNGQSAAVLGGALAYGGSSQGAVNAGSYGITPQGLTSSNYTLSFVDGTLTIDPQVLNVITGSLVGSVSKVYDGTSNVTGLTPANFSLSGWLGTDGATVNRTTGTFSDGPNASASTARPVTVSLAPSDFSPSGSTNLSNYVLPAEVSGNIGEISKRPITGTLVGSISRAYDGSTDASVSFVNYSFNVGNYVVGEGAFLAGTNSWQRGTFASKNVGSGQLVTVNINPADYTPVGSTNLDNYAFPAVVSGNIGSITPKTVTLTAPLLSKVYDGGTAYGTAAADLATLSSQLGVAGDSVSAATLRYADQNAGAGNKTVDLDAVTLDDGNGGANYSVTLASNTTSTIARKDVTVSYAAPISKVYDGTTHADVNVLGFQTSGLVGGDQLYPLGGVDFNTAAIPGTFSGKDVGSHNITASLSGWADINLSTSPAANYNLPSSITISGQITHKTLTVLGTGVAAKVYDGTTAATITAGTIDGLVGGETLGLAASGAFNSKNVGYALATVNYMFSDGTGLLSNYIVPASEQVGAVISRRDVTFTAPQISKGYDGSTAYAGAVDLSPLTAALGVSGDTVTGITLGFEDRHAGASDKTARFSGVAISDGNGGANYNVIYVNNRTSTITPKALTLQAPTLSKVYDGLVNRYATVEELASLSVGLAAGDVLPSATINFSSKDVGSRTVSLSNAVIQDGNAGRNYVVTLGGAAGTITRRPLTLSGVNVTEKEYDGTRAAAFTLGSLQGLVSGEQLNLSAAGSFSSANAGTWPVNLDYSLADGATGNASNYTFTHPTGVTGTITPKLLLVSGTTVAGKVYDGTTQADVTNFGQLNGVIGNDLVTLSATGTFDSKNVGSRIATVNYGIFSYDNSHRNYTVVPFWFYPATITKRPVTVAGLTAQNGFVDQPPLITGKAEVENAVGGDAVSLVGTPTWGYVNPQPNQLVDVRIVANPYALSGAGAANYSLSQPVLKAALVERDVAKVVAAAVLATGWRYSDASNVYLDLGDATGMDVGNGALSMSYRLQYLQEDLKVGRDPTKSFNELKNWINIAIGNLCSRCTFSNSEWDAFLQLERKKSK